MERERDCRSCCSFNSVHHHISILARLPAVAKVQQTRHSGVPEGVPGEGGGPEEVPPGKPLLRMLCGLPVSAAKVSQP